MFDEMRAMTTKQIEDLKKTLETAKEQVKKVVAEEKLIEKMLTISLDLDEKRAWEIKTVDFKKVLTRYETEKTTLNSVVDSHSKKIKIMEKVLKEIEE